ncbi:MAG: hypothetical protein JNJ45_08905 [Chthonomonas sp.]|nr:hypothetical protein [Chthonomonas sp.]
MKRAGRIHWLTITSTIATLAVVGILFMGKETPEQACQRFLVALAKQDVPALTDLTYMEDAKPEEISAAWKKTVTVSAPYFRFAWKFKRSSQPEPNRASVDLSWVKNADSPSAYEENYGIPMEKVDGRWKVDVRAITADFYPGLPR